MGWDGDEGLDVGATFSFVGAVMGCGFGVLCYLDPARPMVQQVEIVATGALAWGLIGMGLGRIVGGFLRWIEEH